MQPSAVNIVEGLWFWERLDTDALLLARLDQIFDMYHELVQLARKADCDWLDNNLAECFGEEGYPSLASRFMVGLLLLKHIWGLSDDDVCELSMPDENFPLVPKQNSQV